MSRTLEAPTAHPTWRTFGRRAVPDPHDLRHLVGETWPGLMDPGPSQQYRYRRGPVHSVIGQPLGVACALLAALRSQPRALSPTRCPSVEELDELTREIEGALGREVTIRAGCKALKQLGLISAYLWAFDVTDIEQYLLSGRGGMVLGLDWYAGMSRPDSTGLIRAWGPPEGGHAVFAWGVDREQGVVLIQNCWGQDWGGWSPKLGHRWHQGCARLPLNDLQKLLHDNGEAVALVKGR